jgi:hypothetical protein
VNLYSTTINVTLEVGIPVIVLERDVCAFIKSRTFAAINGNHDQSEGQSRDKGGRLVIFKIS